MEDTATILRVLVVEDNDGDARLLQEALREGRGNVAMIRAATLAEGLRLLEAAPPHAILLDLHLPDSQGLDSLRRICERAPRVPVIVLTGLDDDATAMTALREGAQDYLAKSDLDARVLLRAVRYAMERKENDALLRDVQEQLLQAQRVESVGRLAGGIAHDFNNLLTVIQGYARMLLDTLPPDSPLQRDMTAIATAADRAARLTQQLLAYSRKQVMQLRVIDPGDVVRGMEQMLRRTIGENISLSVAFAPDLGLVEADPSQIEQVIMNLAVNARDAMPNGGQLMVEGANVTLDEIWVKRHPEVRPGDYVQVSVTDTGVGMTDSVAQHIFDPFFTTKPFGQGTGLGLSTVYGIVKQHHGHIWVYSERDHGTSMKLVLPRVNHAAPSGRETAPSRVAPRGTETLLLVEDEAEILNMLETCLKGLGYLVLTASNGRAALAVMRDHERRIDLLIADVVLPDLSGPELYEGLRGVQADLPVLFMSAYPGDAILQRGMLAPETPFISKPFAPEALAQRIRDVLGTPGAAAP